MTTIATSQDGDVEEIMQRIRAKLEARPPGAPSPASSPEIPVILEHIRLQLKSAQPPSRGDSPESASREFALAGARIEVDLEAATLAHDQAGELNPRQPGLRNSAIQLVKKLIRRSLTWYTRPVVAFQAAVLGVLHSVTRVVQEHDSALQNQAALIQELRRQNAALANELNAQRASNSNAGCASIAKIRPD